MINLFRKDIIEILSYIELIKYDPADRESILINQYSENDEYENILDFNDVQYNTFILFAIRNSYIGVRNAYLISEIFKILKLKVNIVDEEDLSLTNCPCCNFRTISNRGEYEICSICFWEDDGSEELERYSPVNHLSLNQAKINFENIGVVSEKFIEYRDNDLKNKYNI